MKEAVIRYIPIDDHFRMRTDALQQQIQLDQQTGLSPFMVIASAGTTDTGAMDPLDDIGSICQRLNIWYHVDAAYGGFFILAKAVKEKFKGIEKADSITIDPHKGLFLPYGSGAVLVKDTRALYEAHYYKANYLQDTDRMKGEIPPADLSPELTKHFRGLRMWLPLKLFGVETFRAALDEKVWLCRYFYEAVQAIGFEVGPYPDLSIMMFRYVPARGDANAFNAAIVNRLLEDGRVFLSTTTIDDIYWIRLAVVCFRSHLEHVELTLKILQDIVKELEG
ncbi:MAG: aminotransferase class V-fold PLP-dependent enzyme [Bacteroidota bacterium]